MIQKFQISNFKFQIIFAGVLAALLIFLSNQQSSILPPLTEEENFILNPPLVEASRSAKDEHMETVSRLSKMGSVVELNANCRPNPLVLKIKYGESIRFKNKDAVEHTIIIDKDHTITIEANSSKEIRTDFKYGPGDYGYVCIGFGIVGFLDVTEN